MELDRCALIQEDGYLAVEMEFTGDAPGDEILPNREHPFISLRVYIEPLTSNPRLPEAAEEALTHVRGVISDEIRRLEALREGR